MVFILTPLTYCVNRFLFKKKTAPGNPGAAFEKRETIDILTESNFLNGSVDPYIPVLGASYMKPVISKEDNYRCSVIICLIYLIVNLHSLMKGRKALKITFFVKHQ